MLFFILLGFSQSFLAQNAVWPEQLEVTASSLKLREAPNLDAAVLTTIPQGAKVENISILGKERVWDKIDGMGAYWMHLIYKGQTGYAFGAYLKPEFCLFYENLIADYVPKVKNWYGVYSTPKGDELRKITVYISMDSVEMSGALVPILHTNDEAQSKFVIGTDRELKSGIIGDYYLRHNQWGPGNNFRYELGPGKTVALNSLFESLQLPGGFYEILCTGSFTVGPKWLEQHDFKIWATEKQTYNGAYSNKQDLSPYFSPNDQTCTLKWWGDLDGDNKPDVLIGRCATGEGGCTDYLFLSSKAETGEMLHPVTLFYHGLGC